MHADDTLLHQLVRCQLGVVTRKQLHEAGLRASAIDRRVRSGVLVRLHPGVFRHAGAPPSPLARVLAAVLAAGPGAAASHRTALWLHHLWPGLGPIEIVTTARQHIDLEGVTGHRSCQLGPADLTTVGSIATTTIPRSLLDLGAVRPFDDVERTFQNALLERRTDMGAILATLERIGRRGRNGTAALRACVHQSEPDARLESELELRLLGLVRRAGLPEPVLQHEILLRDGVARLDFAWPDAMLAIEADGRRWHATTDSFRRDLARSRSLQALGWHHYRYGWHDVVDTPRAVLAELTTLRDQLID